MSTINDRIREIFEKDNVIMAGWNEKFEDGKKVTYRKPNKDIRTAIRE